MKKAKRLVSLAAIASLTLTSALPAFAANSSTTTTNGMPSTSVMMPETTEAIDAMEAVEEISAPAYANLSYSEKHYIGYSNEDLGVYPIVKGMDELNYKIEDKIFKSYAYSASDTDQDYANNILKCYYSVEDMDRYAKITLYIDFNQASKYFMPTTETYEYYIDKETNKEITKEAYDVAMANQDMEEPVVEEQAVANTEVKMLPLEETAKTLGYELKQEKGSNVVILTMDGDFFTSIVVDSNSYMVDGKSTELSSAPVMKDGIIYAPVDFFEEVLNAVVSVENGVTVVTPRADLAVYN